jgi:hypothetical protein
VSEPDSRRAGHAALRAAPSPAGRQGPGLETDALDLLGAAGCFPGPPTDRMLRLYYEPVPACLKCLV